MKIINKNRQEKGITLIALVVTIVVLLILAGVSISLVLGNNGLINKTKEAREETNKGSLKDTITTIMAEWQIEQYTTNADFATFLNSKVPDTIDAVTDNGDGTFDIEKDGYTITVSSDGTIGETSKIGPKPQVRDIKVVANSDGTGDSLGAKSTDEGTTLYITFSHSIEGGTTTVSPTLPYAVTANGTYEFTVTGTVNGETSNKTVTVTVNQYKSAFNIGDYVNYTYDEGTEESPITYSLASTQSGYSDQTVTQSTTTLKWRILNIDEASGKIDLISDAPTSNTVYFQGALGYNNGVYLLNDMCAALYSNSSKGITARSINLEDMEKHLTEAGIAARNAYVYNGVQYGNTKTYLDSYSYYPKLYPYEIGSGVNVTEANKASITQPDKTIANPDPYKESRNSSSSEFAVPTAEKHTQATDKVLTVTQTYYNISISNTYYGEAASVLSNSYSYGVASRFARCYSPDADFGLRVADKNMDGGGLIRYSNFTNVCFCRLRPVVSLDSSLLDGTKDKGGAWNLNW